VNQDAVGERQAQVVVAPRRRYREPAIRCQLTLLAEFVAQCRQGASRQDGLAPVALALGAGGSNRLLVQRHLAVRQELWGARPGQRQLLG